MTVRYEADTGRILPMSTFMQQAVDNYVEKKTGEWQAGGTVKEFMAAAEPKFNVLADYLKITNLEELEESEWSSDIFTTDGDEEYLVLTPEEAHASAVENLAESFDDHNYELIEAMQMGAHNWSRFFDRTAWAKWIISVDGLGPELATWDGEQNEHKGYLIFRRN
jgi:hypothetical protein